MMHVVPKTLREPPQRRLDVNDVLAALRRSWTAATCNDEARWSPANPSYGQCAVSALILQDHFGGRIQRCESPTGSHYFNLLPDGTTLDATKEQFGPDFRARGVEERDREYVLSFPATEKRYKHLRQAVDEVVFSPS